MTEAALLPDLARGWARRRADAPAVLDAGVRWSWAELDRRADAIASAIAAAVPTAGGRVGLVLGGSPLAVAALHGAVRGGLDAVLLNPRLTAAEHAAILAAADVAALVVDPAAGAAVPDGLAMIDAAAVLATPMPPAVLVPARPRQPELVVPTSGTTAAPKLVRLPLDRVAASAAAWIAVLPPASGWLLSLGLGHVAGVGIVARAALDGVPVVVPATLDPADLLAAMEEATADGVTVSHLSVVATQLGRLLDLTDDGRPPEGLAAVLLGGGPIPEALVRRALAAGWPVVPSYGMTETTSGVVALPTVETAARPWSAGRPLPGVALRIDRPGSDPPAGPPAEPSVGEILVRGPMVFAGYLGEADGSRAVLGPDGWLRTGDLGSLDDDGWLRVLDRHDDLIVSGGENVAPAEVEAALATHPAVVDVAVVGVPDPTWGRVPVAVVELRQAAVTTDDALAEHARATLAAFKVPRRFVRVERLPRSPAGKLLRRRLAEMATAATATEPSADAPPSGSAPASTRIVVADDGQRLAVRPPGADDARPAVVLLHATLSWSGQLAALARRLEEHASVALLDRRGSGASRMARPSPVSVARHVADLVAVLDDLGLERPVLVGHSFGGVVALEAAARHRDRVGAVLAWEPPYLAVAEPAVRDVLAAVADRVAEAFERGGSEAAAREFLESVTRPGAWDRLHPRQRSALADEGTGALADAAMGGLDPDGLRRIAAPVILATGEASEPFYAPVADALAARIPTAVRRTLPGLRHPAPITDPDPIADLVLELLVDHFALEPRR